MTIQEEITNMIVEAYNAGVENGVIFEKSGTLKKWDNLKEIDKNYQKVLKSIRAINSYLDICWTEDWKNVDL